MSFYDIFLKNNHPVFVEKILVGLNTNIIDYILKSYLSKNISILEVGPGKGYFYTASKKYNGRIEYEAVDRNLNILKNLGDCPIYLSELPEMPKLAKRYDVIYASFVLEHLKNGKEVFMFLSECKKILKDNGLVVLFVPDSMKLHEI